MSLTRKEVIKAHQAVMKLIEQDRSKGYDLKLSVRVKLGENLLKTRPVFENYLKEHEKLVRDLGAQVPNTDKITVTPENIDKFNSLTEETLNEEVDVKLSPLIEADLGGNQVDIELLGDMRQVGLLK